MCLLEVLRLLQAEGVESSLRHFPCLHPRPRPPSHVAAYPAMPGAAPRAVAPLQKEPSARHKARRRAATAGAARLRAGRLPQEEVQVATMAAMMMTTTAMPALSVVFRTFATALARKRKRPGKHRSALRGTFRFGFAGVPNAPNIERWLFKHKERARESPLGFSQAPIEQKKRNKPPLRNRLGSLAAVGLVLARSLCSILMAALHLARSNAALGRVRTVQNVPFSVRKGQCTVTVRKHLPKRCTI